MARKVWWSVELISMVQNCLGYTTKKEQNRTFQGAFTNLFLIVVYTIYFSFLAQVTIVTWANENLMECSFEILMECSIGSCLFGQNWRLNLDNFSLIYKENTKFCGHYSSKTVRLSILIIPRETRGYRFQLFRLSVCLSVRLRVQAISPKVLNGKFLNWTYG